MVHIVYMPRLGANISQATIVEWMKAVGDPVVRGDVLVVLETAKAAFELEADESGILRHVGAFEGASVPYNQPLAIIAGSDDDIGKALDLFNMPGETYGSAFERQMDESVFNEPSRESLPDTIKKNIATPAAFSLAEKQGIDRHELESLARFTVRGFVTERDLRNYLQIEPAYIYGASTGAKQIFEILSSGVLFRVIAIIDDNTDLHGRTIHDVSVIGGIETLREEAAGKNIAVLIASHSHNRRKILSKVNACVPGALFPPLVDRRAVLMRDVEVGEGVLIEAGCIVGHEVKIGRGVILNIGASLSHNCVIGDFSHLAIGVSISGAVTIGANCFIGAGASINPAVCIGDNVIIAPGSAVMNDIPSDVTVMGVPARIIGDSKRGSA